MIAVSVLAGAALSWWLHVVAFSLIATLFCLAIASFGITHDWTAGSILIFVGVGLAALQVGYGLGHVAQAVARRNRR